MLLRVASFKPIAIHERICINGAIYDVLVKEEMVYNQTKDKYCCHLRSRSIKNGGSEAGKIDGFVREINDIMSYPGSVDRGDGEDYLQLPEEEEKEVVPEAQRSREGVSHSPMRDSVRE